MPANRNDAMNEFDIGWELWRSFLAVMDEKSFAGAARRLHVSQPTVSRHIDQLETALGAKLFTRAQNGLTPTDLAHSLEPHALGMAASADALKRAATGDVDSEEGVVRVTATEIVSTEVLPPILAGFMHEHPGIRIELHVSNRSADLLRRDADIGVRSDRPQQGALLARRLGEIRLGFFVHRAYAERRGLPEKPGDLARHAIIGPDRDVDTLRGMVLAGQQVTPDVFTFRTDNHTAQLAALRAAVGIGVCQVAIAARDPDLLPVLPDWRFDREIWLSMHEDLKTSRRIRLVYDFLGETLAEFLKA
jgi:Transcriptional regulator